MSTHAGLISAAAQLGAAPSARKAAVRSWAQGTHSSSGADHSLAMATRVANREALPIARLGTDGNVLGPATLGMSSERLPTSENDRTSGHKASPLPAVASATGKALASPGSPLDLATRAWMEDRFHHDFSKVRVHTDRRASATARLLGAKAFTIGTDIAVDLEQVRSGTLASRRTLGHELAHVVQARRRSDPYCTVGHDRSEAEREATAVARRVARGDHVPESALVSGAPGLMCEYDPQLPRILEDLPLRIQLRARLYGRQLSADETASFIALSLRGIDLTDRDNRAPILDTLRPLVSAEAYNRFLNSIGRAQVMGGGVGPGQYPNRPSPEQLRASFLADVRHVAHEYLQGSRRFAQEEFQRLGISPARARSDAAPTAAQDETVRRMQIAAGGLHALRWAQESARRTYVAYRWQLRGMGDFGYAIHWRRVRFDPEDPRPRELRSFELLYFGPQTAVHRDPDATNNYIYSDATEEHLAFDDEREAQRAAPIQSYTPVRHAFDRAETAAEAIMRARPALAYLVPNQLEAFVRAATPAAARRELGIAIGNLITDIDRTSRRLGGELDLRDLTPLHAHLLGGSVPSASGTDWTAEPARSIASDLIRDHHVDRELWSLGLQYLAHVAFLVAPIGPSTALAGSYVGAAATEASYRRESDRHSALAAAARASGHRDATLVSREAVDEARMAAESAAVAFALAGLTLGTAAAHAQLDQFRRSYIRVRALAPFYPPPAAAELPGPVRGALPARTDHPSPAPLSVPVARRLVPIARPTPAQSTALVRGQLPARTQHTDPALLTVSVRGRTPRPATGRSVPSRYRVGGGGTRATIPAQWIPTAENPHRDPEFHVDHCGYCAIARALRNLGGGSTTAEALYQRTMRQLFGEMPTEAPPPRMLVYPDIVRQGATRVPLGYEAFFGSAVHISEYTVTAVARDVAGLIVTNANSLREDLRVSFGQQPFSMQIPGGRAVTREMAIEILRRINRIRGSLPPIESLRDLAEVELEDQHGQLVQRVRSAVEADVRLNRSRLPGEYILGSRTGPSSQGHYINLTVGSDGTLNAADAQRGSEYRSWDAIDAALGGHPPLILRVERGPAAAGSSAESHPVTSSSAAPPTSR